MRSQAQVSGVNIDDFIRSWKNDFISLFPQKIGKSAALKVKDEIQKSFDDLGKFAELSIDSIFAQKE